MSQGTWKAAYEKVRAQLLSLHAGDEAAAFAAAHRVDEMTSPPIVGRTYLVPCVRGDIGHRTPRWEWLPVTGPPHDDFDVFPRVLRHYHLDVRFVHLALVAPFPDHFRYPGVTRAFYRVQLIADTLGAGEVSYQALRCIRRLPEHPGFSPYLQIALEALVRGQTLRDPCKVCPHRGVPLASLPVAADGTVTCPGHGLKWDVSTGRLVRRR